VSVSLTSCFKFAIELPEATLTSLLRAVIAQGETAGIATTFEQPDVSIDGYHAHISASLVDSDARPSTSDITTTENHVVLGLHADLRVTVDEIVGLDSVDYHVDFNLPGVVSRKDSVTPAVVEITFPGVTPPDLAIVVSDPELEFTAALFEPPIHQLYTDNPSLHGFTQPNVTVPEGQVLVQVWLYDDAPSAPDFHGSITVQIPMPMQIRVIIPGRMKMTNISSVTVHDFTFTVSIDIDIAVEPAISGGDNVVVKLHTVTASDISVTYDSNAPFYANVAITPIMQAKVVTLLAGMTEPSREIPSKAQVADRVSAALVDYSSTLELPLMPLAATPGTTVDLGSAVPTTIGGTCIAVLIDQQAGEPCDGAEDFTATNPIAIGMSAFEAQSRIESAAASVDGQTVHVSGYDVTLNRPTGSLEDPGEHGEAEGHFWIAGTAVVHVGGCVGDVDAEYHGPVMLDPQMRPDGTVGFTLRPGSFGGSADVKSKKDQFDPNAIASTIQGWNFDFPTIPTSFPGVATLTLNITQALISRKGIVLTGGVGIERLQALLAQSVLPISTFWGHESAGGG
jgi:hypothetical protein